MSLTNFIDVTETIKNKIKTLENERDKLEILANNKANSLRDYRRKLAKTMIQLKNGIEFDVDGAKVQNPLTTILEKIAKGISADEEMMMDLHDSLYKNQRTIVDAIKSELNGYQSINRYLDTTS